MSKRALVSGAHGFVGRHVARHLAGCGFQVAGIGHGAWSRDQWREWGLDEWHGSEVDLDALVTYAGEPDMIVHCAGSGSVSFSIAHPYHDFQRTAQTTIAVLEYARLYAPEARIVIPSSGAVYGASARLPIPESAPPGPVSPYGMHKHFAEELCRYYASLYALRTAIVRFFSVYGVGLRKQLLWDACRKLSQSDTTFAGTGEERRDWLHVDDAVNLLYIAADHASVGCPIVNGGSGRSASVAEVLSMLKDGFPAAGAIRFSGARRKGDPVHLEADIARAQAWGWQPAMSLEQGIAQYLSWFQSGAL
jgi:UDP-glucose 4-epimerase